MSTAVAEPPATDTKPEPAKAHPGSVTIDLENLVAKPVKTEKPPEQTQDDAAAKEAAAKAEAAKAEADKAAEAQKTAEAKKGGDKEENMANLRKAREAAELAARTAAEERDRIKAELESLRTKSTELPEDVKAKLTAAEEAEKERQELRKQLRQADLARDPEFQAKYTKNINARIGMMGDIAIAAGVTQDDWKRAVSNWNEEQFAEFRESMTPAQRVKFDAAWTGAVDLYQQQQTELANSDTTYAELEKQRKAQAEAQQKEYFSQNEQLARTVMAEILKPEGTKEYTDLPAAVEAVVLKAARHELSPQEVFHQLAANQVLARVTNKQKTRIEELEGQLAEREKKIQEQEEFISQHASAVPRGDAAGKTVDTSDDKPIWQQILVKPPGA